MNHELAMLDARHIIRSMNMQASMLDELVADRATELEQEER